MNTKNVTATLRVWCPDRKGLVAALSRLLYDHGANILQAQQYSDPIDRHFFQRIRFDLIELDISRKALEDLLEIECGRYQMVWRISYSDQPKQVAIFVSKFEHCLSDLLLRHRLGEFECQIRMIVSNHPNLETVATQFGIPYHHIPITADTRTVQEEKERTLLEQEKIDLVILARYMQILSGNFVARFPDRIINIHHSFLPAFSGARPYQQAHERGVKLIGATAHYATSELDEGPILTQEVVRCSHHDSIADLARKGRDAERIALAAAVRAHLDDRIVVHGRRTIVF